MAEKQEPVEAVASAALPMLLSKRQVAELAGLGVSSVERLAAKRVLKIVRPAGMRCVRFFRWQVLAWIEKGCPGPAVRAH